MRFKPEAISKSLIDDSTRTWEIYPTCPSCGAVHEDDLRDFDDDGTYTCDHCEEPFRLHIVTIYSCKTEPAP